MPDILFGCFYFLAGAGAWEAMCTQRRQKAKTTPCKWCPGSGWFTACIGGLGIEAMDL